MRNFSLAAVSHSAMFLHCTKRGPHGGHMQRRKFLTFLGGAAAWPFAARAQKPAMPVIGFLNSGLSHGYTVALTGFKQGLKDRGYIEGQNVAIEYRWAEGKNERLPALAAELVGRKVAVMAVNTAALLPATKATKTIPIVFVSSVDPVKLGVVASLQPTGRKRHRRDKPECRCRFEAAGIAA